MFFRCCSVGRRLRSAGGSQPTFTYNERAVRTWAHPLGTLGGTPGATVDLFSRLGLAGVREIFLMSARERYCTESGQTCPCSQGIMQA